MYSDTSCLPLIASTLITIRCTRPLQPTCEEEGLRLRAQAVPWNRPLRVTLPRHARGA